MFSCLPQFFSLHSPIKSWLPQADRQEAQERSFHASVVEVVEILQQTVTAAGLSNQISFYTTGVQALLHYSSKHKYIHTEFPGLKSRNM